MQVCALVIRCKLLFNDCRMKNYWKATFLSLGLLLGAAGGSFFFGVNTASAATYYVSTSGNNANVGSIGSPWRSLQRAETGATTGDLVVVNSGSYTENDSVQHAWNVTKGISWTASGTVIVKSNASATTVLNVSGTNTASFTGFTFDAETTKTKAANLASGTTKKTFTRCTFKDSTADLILTGNTNSGITILSSTFTTAAGEGIKSGGNTNLTVSGSTFTLTGTSFSAYEYTAATAETGIIFSNNTVTANTTHAINITSVGHGVYTIRNNTFTTAAAALRVAGRNSVTFTNNAVTSTSYGVYLTSSGSFTIANNTFTVNSGSPNPMLLATGSASGTLLFQNNTMSINVPTTAGSPIQVDAGTWGTTLSGNTITMQTTGVTANTNGLMYIADQFSPVVQGNTLDTTGTGSLNGINVTSQGGGGGVPRILNNTIRSRSWGGIGITLGRDNSTAGDTKYNGGIIQGNTIYGPYYYNTSLNTQVTTHGILFGHNYNGIVQYNTVNGEGYGIVMKSIGGSNTSGGVFYNKLINNKGFTGVRIKGTANLAVTNNTIYADATTGYSSFDLINISINNAGQYGSGAMLRNNILETKGAVSSLITFDDTTSQAGFTSDYNTIYRTTAGNSAYYDAVYKTFAQWQALGFDTHSLTSDPLFTDVSTYDYTLPYNSPVIDTGTGTSFTVDLLGNPLYGAADFGALEYQPPYVMATDQVDASGSLTVYKNGKYRNATAAVGKSSDLAIAPAAGFTVGNYAKYGTVVMSTWNTLAPYYKKWTETILGVTPSVTHTIGNLAASTTYQIKKNGSALTTTTTNGSGRLTFTDTGSTSVIYEVLSPSTTTLTSSVNPSGFGSSTTLTATISPSSATGSVTFYDGVSSLGSATLSQGSGTLSVSSFTTGTHSLSAVYAGNVIYATSTSSTLTQTVGSGTTALSLGSSPNPSIVNQSVTFTATVTPSTATGTVTFLNGIATLGTVTLGHGSGSVTVSGFEAGTQSLTATYNGNTNWLTSTSSVLSQLVNGSSSTTTTSGGGGGGSRGGSRGSNTTTPSGPTPSAPSPSTPDSPSHPAAPAPSAPSFTDVPPQSWFADYVALLAEKGIVSGYANADGTPTGLFKPADNVTVAESLKMVLEATGHSPARSSVEDWTAPYREQAASLGLSLPENLARPATRAEVVAMLLSLIPSEALPSPAQNTFSDLPASHPHFRAVLTAVALGFVKGDGNATTFRPDDAINRAEVSKVISLYVMNALAALPPVTHATPLDTATMHSAGSVLPAAPGGQMLTTTASLKLHVEPSLDSPALTSFDPDTVVELLSIRGDWAEVRYSWHQGWVVRAYLR